MMARMITNISAMPTPMDHVTDMLLYLNTLPTIPFTDLTIQTEDSSIRIHSTLLVSFSPMLSSVLSPLPSSSPHPFLPGMSSTSPHISVSIVNKLCLPLFREMMYTGFCMGTEEEMKEVLVLMDILGLEQQQFSLDEISVDMTSDTLGLGAIDGDSIDQDNDIEQDENEDHHNDGEQVAVQEIENLVECVLREEHEEQSQFTNFIQEKFAQTVDKKKCPGQAEVDIARNSFFCPHCHVKFTKLIEMEIHALVEHSYEQPFLCQECGKRLKMKEDVQQHMRKHGGGSFQIQCEVCDKICKTMTIYFSHYKIHKDLREFGCCTCGKSFSQFKNLKKHEELHGPMKFSCKECGKMFRRMNNLKQHQEKWHKK